MKKVKTFRIAEQVDIELNKRAQQLGISASQLVELACIKMLSQQDNNTDMDQLDISAQHNPIMIKLNVTNANFGKLLRIVRSKNTTLAQEIRYRLTATLDSPVFDTQEYHQLAKLRIDLNRYGNLLKLAINQEIPFDNGILMSTKTVVTELEKELISIMDGVKNRMLRGS